MASFNRLLWALVGLLLLAIGVAGIAAGSGILGPPLAQTAPVPTSLARQAIGPTDTALLTLAAAGSVALLVGLLLLRAELHGLRPARMPDLRYEHPDREQTQRRGRTVVRGGGLEHGTRQSLEELPGVRSAQARLLGDSDRPDLLIELDVEARTQLSKLKSDVRRAIERFRLTSGRQPSTQVQIRLVNARRSVE
jgi:hypothetical protein